MSDDKTDLRKEVGLLLKAWLSAPYGDTSSQVLDELVDLIQAREQAAKREVLERVKKELKRVPRAANFSPDPLDQEFVKGWTSCYDNTRGVIGAELAKLEVGDE